MFIIYGKKAARIRTATYHEYACKNCNDLNLSIKVYKEYFHVFYIPIFPVGGKDVAIRCNTCGEAKWIDGLRMEYEQTSKTPFYLYAGLLLVAALILFGVVANMNTQSEKRRFVENPVVGDVYTMSAGKSDTTMYYFLRISRIQRDTVYCYRNNFVYYNFVSSMDKNDFFRHETEFGYLKKDLKKMLENGEINGVNRGYGDEEGFNRIQ